jgi:ribosomal protein S12 methylthiotransferase
VGVFSYSKEDGTKAAELGGQLHANVKRKRRKKLIEILQAQRNEKLSQLIGTEIEVMVEGAAEETELLIQARMPTQAQEIDGRVLINDIGDLEPSLAPKPGEFAIVRIHEIADADLIASLIRVSKRATVASPGLTVTLTKGAGEMRNERTAH